MKNRETNAAAEKTIRRRKLEEKIYEEKS